MRFKQFSSNLERPFRKTKGKNMRFSFITITLKLFVLVQLVITSPNLIAQTKLGYVKVDEVIRKAKEEAILDKKFGLTIKEYGDCSDGNNRAKRGSSTESDRDSSNVSSSDDSDY